MNKRINQDQWSIVSVFGYVSKMPWKPAGRLRPALLVLCLSGALGTLAAPGPQAPAPKAAAAAKPPRPRPLPFDRTTPLPKRRLDEARLRELASEREFRYVEPDQSTSAWDAFWARIWRWLGNLLRTPTGRFTWKYGMYAAILAALVYAVLKLLQVDVTAAFGRAGRRGQLAYDTEAENIHEVDFRTRIAEAEEAGNFRLATRLGYLEVLKHLTDGGFIQWQPDKTNHAYLFELPAGPLRDAFRAATREFEYVWYGELRLSPALYQQARASQRAVSALAAGTPRVAPAAPNALPA
ncbi:DUF4129 domain-containing protein [Hymenobacter ruricola]|uniref:DUF4129 domain-containing protein n=1 Tax=Hymenobacter ruricola TaxID=2791023 RepID=A0ABS0HZD6_9BACT|nr:DUF4129 domain-containing protein [Hymenobacter ruricola]MBF9220073.1 DUF4129 domain-containing protein [Hymenobacter ruricola]